jgi:L-aminopeptidase/D-esterase-like protein
MSAYLAWRLTKELGDSKAAEAAVFTAEKGYQFASLSLGRDPARAFTSDTFDPFNNIMRMDLTYSAAGSAYGAAVAEGKTASLDIDRGIRKIMNKSEMTPSVSRSEAEDLVNNHPIQAFREWSKRFAPDAVFDLYAD